MKKLFVTLFVLVLCAVGASALVIEQPLDTTYEASPIPLSIVENQSADSITYAIDGNWVDGCTACASLQTQLDVAPGLHTLDVRSFVGDQVNNASVNFTVLELLPINGTGNETNVTNGTLNLTNGTFGNQTNETTNGTVGNQTNGTNGTFGNESNLTNGTFGNQTNGTVGNQTNGTNGSTNQTNGSMELFDLPFQVEISSPTNMTYGQLPILFQINANATLDSLILWNGTNATLLCQNCFYDTRWMNFSAGNHTIVATGYLGNRSVSDNVTFTVLGNASANATILTVQQLQRLPGQMENGTLTDEQLAQAIRANELPPGVATRLINTGELGEESMLALIETQRRPIGIFRRLLDALGFVDEQSYPEAIYRTHNGMLSTKVIEAILESNETPADVKAELGGNQSGPGNSGQNGSPGNSGNVPPNNQGNAP